MALSALGMGGGDSSTTRKPDPPPGAVKKKPGLGVHQKRWVANIFSLNGIQFQNLLFVYFFYFMLCFFHLSLLLCSSHIIRISVLWECPPPCKFTPLLEEPVSVPALDLLAVYDPPRATLGPPTGSVAVGAQDPPPERRLPDGPPPTAAAPVPQGPPEPIPENGGGFPDDVYDLLRPCLNLGGGSWGVDVHKTEVEFCSFAVFHVSARPAPT